MVKYGSIPSKGVDLLEITKKFLFPDSGAQYKGSYDEPSECPLCKHKIKPEELHAATYKDEDGLYYLSFLYLCHHCYRVFTALHHCRLSSSRDGLRNVFESTNLYIGPSFFTPQEFDEPIRQLSPQFDKIYNQALAAESDNLDEIAGIGYRKALEFLVKDFCIHLHPSEDETIKAKPLSRCINDYIDNLQIRTLAEKATWIGNDETHYIRKIENRDITDMKKFIKAMVYFVGMMLVSEDAESIPHA